MNIYILDQDPAKAAIMQCDKHVVKMPLEAAQMMASAMRHHGCTDIDMPLTKSGKPYGNAHPHHPCTLWAGERRANFNWLGWHGMALCGEYTHRYGKIHACEAAIRHMLKFDDRIPSMNTLRHSRFTQALPDACKMKSPIEAYRRYYINFKDHIAKWDRGRPAPEWWPHNEGAAA